MGVGVRRLPSSSASEGQAGVARDGGSCVLLEAVSALGLVVLCPGKYPAGD